MSHNIGNINKNMDKYITIMFKMKLQKSIISAGLCFVRVSSRIGLGFFNESLGSASFTSLIYTIIKILYC